MKLKRMMALFSGAAVLMTSVTGGCFSVAADQTEAEQTFARYQKCTDCYLRNWQRGKSLEALTVSLPEKSRL